MISLYNTLTKSVQPLKPLKETMVSIYSCGPTVYDHVHIGNLSAFIAADTLRRVITANELEAKHVMNFTDVDDKTIRRSHERYPELPPMDALKKLTREYGELFLEDMRKIGNDTEALTFIEAADDNTIEGMRRLISDLHAAGFAYIADDGVYFSIAAYKKSGKTYGQLVELSEANTSNERIQNDEYDKESAHDFALWKTQKEGEPAWEFELDGHDLHGRPGWHIECSVMSEEGLGQPFDIHTGGIDLAFPHHENEIAQSTALTENSTYAQMFVHNEHILVDGKKMSKSLGNFYTLSDLIERGVDPLAFRLLVLQSHYRKQTNFSFENVKAAHNRLQHWKQVAVLRWQTHDTLHDDTEKDSHDTSAKLLAARHAALEALSTDLNTPEALRIIEEVFTLVENTNLDMIQQEALRDLIMFIDLTLGLHLQASTEDISDAQKQLIIARERARDNKDWTESDRLPDELKAQGIGLNDHPSGTRWSYL